MSLNGLAAFEAVGRCNSVALAAQELGVSPGAVSQQLKKVEEALGTTLFRRKGRGLELTPFGRLYHHEISKGFRQFAYAAEALERARNEGSLVLSALSSIVNKWIGRKIFDWRSLHPDVRVHVVGRDSEPNLGFDDTDFRITYGLANARRHDHYAEFYRDHVTPACSPVLVPNGISDLREVFSYPLLHVEWERHFDPPFPGWGLLARQSGTNYAADAGSLSFTMSSTAIEAAVNKRGFVLAQMSMIADELEAGTLIAPFAVRIPLPESYYLAWHASVLQKPYGAEFRRWLQAMAQAEGLNG